MSKATVKQRIKRLQMLVEKHGFDQVREVSGLEVSSLANYIKSSARTTVGHNTLRLLELELEMREKASNESSTDIR